LTDARQEERARIAVLTSIGQAIKGKGMDPAQGAKFLLDIRADPSLSTPLRQAVLMALGISSQPPVLRYLVEATSDPEPQIRVAAVDALARFVPPQVSLLDKLARSPDQVVRTRANLILNKYKTQ
jgi:HEAT repeat protein